MESLIRAAAVYAFLLVIFRIAGRRSIAQVTTFDLVFTLIISESIQQAMIDDDNSMTNGFLLVVTLVGLNILFSLLKQRSRRFELLIDGTPLVVIERGRLLRERMNRERVDEEDILHAARSQAGLRQLDDIDYAVLERDGSLTLIPRKEE